MLRESGVAVTPAAVEPMGFFGTESYPPSHIIGPDVSHHQGHITADAWRSCLDTAWVRFAGCKISQGNNFVDPEGSWNLDQCLAAVDRKDIDFGKFYLWPNKGQPVIEQCNLFCKVVGSRIHHPGFVFDLDVEGGTVAEVNAIMEEMQQRMQSAARTLVYGGAYIRFTLGDPSPQQVPALARAGFKIVPKYGECCPIRPKYIGSEPDILWQYTDVVYGPADRANYPRQVGQMRCDFSTQLGTLAQYQERVGRLPGQQQEEDLTKDETQKLIDDTLAAAFAKFREDFGAMFKTAFAAQVGFQPADAGHWLLGEAGEGDVIRGYADPRNMPDPYKAHFAWAKAREQDGDGGGEVPPHEHAVTGKAT
jgi:hypothetical protein